MTAPDLPAGRQGISVLARELERLLKDRGSLSSTEACRLLLRAEEIPTSLARSILAGLVAGDGRFCVSPDGQVRAAPPRGLPLRPLRRLSFTVLDLETTGGSPVADRILEVGAVRIEEGGLGECFATLVNPGVPIPAFISSMTGIRPEMVSAAPAFAAVGESIATFIGDSVLVAHNLPFDRGFLNQELARNCGFVLTNPSLCTVRLARKLLPHLPDRRLDTLADHFGFAFSRRHRALGDAEVTARLVLKFIARLEEAGFRDLEGVERFLAGGRS